MLIFIEGVDGSGKSTLCKKLTDMGAKQAIIPRGSERQFDSYMDIEYEDMYAEGDIIFDRCFITDLVYRLQDGGPADKMDLLEMCTILQFGNCKIIHCVSSTAFEDSIVRGEDNITDKNKSAEIAYLYDKIITMFEKYLNVPVMRYNWKYNNIDDVINFIKGGEKFGV